jgi:ABC-type dipeptide/oligopeptide/nickel transport system permease subunit
LKIIFTEIAPNMMSYLFMTFILQFGGAILIAVTLDFIGLGPTKGISLGTDDEQRRAVERAAAGHVVVVYPAGDCHHRHRGRPVCDERRAGRSLQPQA